MEKNTLTIGGLSLLGVIIFLVVAYKLTGSPPQSVFTQLQSVKKTDHVRWSPSKKHIFFEYSDLQCPACKTYYGFLEEIAKDKAITNNITFVYRHFPLEVAHKNARVAAQAAEAAGNQGKFFEMHDLLFTRQDLWSGSDKPMSFFETYAAELKLDLKKFRLDYASPAVQARIQEDVVSGGEIGVDATPSFYLDGKKIENVRSAEELKTILKKAIE